MNIVEENDTYQEILLELVNLDYDLYLPWMPFFSLFWSYVFVILLG